MKNIGSILAAPVLVALLSSCCNPGPTGPYLQAAGYFTGAKDVAAVWKDSLAAGGEPTVTKLYESGTSNARALSVFVSGTDVYLSGFFQNSAGNDAACYWKNGVKEDLYSDGSGSEDARASGIFVDGSDVYVSGYLTVASVKTAGYWKNTSWVPLDATAGEATDIVVSGADVYVSGYVKPSTIEHSCYWVNGTREDLYVDNYSVGYAITISGTDVYVAGYYFDGVLIRNLAGYWKNGVWAPLHDTSTAKAFDVLVNGTDIYVAGYYNNGSTKTVACYWKNGSVVNLYTDTVNNAQASGICVDGTDVYVAGYVDAGTKAASYWKNGVRTPLESAASECYSLAIQD